MRAIHFLHIRKTGGNALKAALRPIAEEYRLVIHDHHTTLRDIPPGERVAFAVRDPVDRFVSGFNSRLRMGRPLLNSKWSTAEAEAFAQFRTPNELAEALTSPAREAALNAMRDIAHVRTSFADTLGSRDDVLERLEDIVWIGHTETLGNDFEMLKHRLGLPSSTALPSDPVAAHRTPDGFSTSLSKTGRRNVRNWYAADIEFVAWLEHIRKPLLGSHQKILIRNPGSFSRGAEAPALSR